MTFKQREKDRKETMKQVEISRSRNISHKGENVIKKISGGLLLLVAVYLLAVTLIQIWPLTG